MRAMSFWVYILTSERNTTLHVGVTGDPCRRIRAHKAHITDPATRKYNLEKLVYIEQISDPTRAVAREMQITGMARLRKEVLINRHNPEWQEIVLEEMPSVPHDQISSISRD